MAIFMQMPTKDEKKGRKLAEGDCLLKSVTPT